MAVKFCDAAETMLDCNPENSQTLGSRVLESLSNWRVDEDAQELSPHLCGLSLSSLTVLWPLNATLLALPLAAV